MNLLVLKGFEAGKKRLKGLSWASWLCVHGVETEISRISVIWKNMRHDCFAFNKVSVPYGYGMFCSHFPFWFVCLFGFVSFLVSFKDLILKASPTSCSTPESVKLIGGLDPYSEIFPS